MVLLTKQREDSTICIVLRLGTGSFDWLLFHSLAWWWWLEIIGQQADAFYCLGGRRAASPDVSVLRSAGGVWTQANLFSVHVDFQIFLSRRRFLRCWFFVWGPYSDGSCSSMSCYPGGQFILPWAQHGRSISSFFSLSSPSAKATHSLPQRFREMKCLWSTCTRSPSPSSSAYPYWRSPFQAVSLNPPPSK